MDKEKVVELAKKIVELDVKRDEMFESLMMVSGNKGYEILRMVQNSMYGSG